MRRSMIFENSDWLVVNKPTGISTHGAFPGDMSIQDWIRLHWDLETFVCSRLDKGTSGVLMFARSAHASGEAQRIHEQEKSEKEYVFLSDRDSLSVSGKSEWDCSVELDGLSARTQFRRVQRIGSYTLYSALIRRGRTHQIRRHASMSGVPILGDDEHGGTAASRLFLHCHRVCWPGIEQPWQAEIPASFLDASWLERCPEFLVSFDRRGEWIQSISDARRIIHRGELTQFDVSVDLYARHLCIWVYDETNTLAESEELLRPMVAEIAHRTAALGWVYKRTRRNPHTNKFVDEEIVGGESPSASFLVHEHDLVFNIGLVGQQHAGLFLDQRDNRRLVAKGASGRRMANLFAYTCSFSVAGLAGGAEVVFSVDLSRKFLEQGAANVAANRLERSGRAKFIAEDARKWLERQRRKVEREGDAARLGMVVCDPPTFSSSGRAGEFRVDRTWELLSEMVSDIMVPGGIVFFSNNHQKGSTQEYQRVLERHFAKVERRVPPIDFPDVGARGKHVRLFRCFAR